MSEFITRLNVFVDQFSPEEARKIHINVARAGLAEFIKQHNTPSYTIETDGNPTTTEETVRPFGVIAYTFLVLRDVIEFALEHAREVSPVLSGDYRDSWFPMIGTQRVSLDDIKGHETVIITNDQPYSRKINTGAKGFEKYVPPNVVEKVRQAVLAKYGNVVEANLDFLKLEGGWILRHGLRHIRNGRRYGAFRKDASAGSPITYPSIRIEPRSR